MFLSLLAQYTEDWCLCAALQFYVLFIGNRTPPFLREFDVTDPSLQHPYTEYEQVSDFLCLSLAFIVLGTIIVLSELIEAKFNFSNLKKRNLHHLHISVLALVMSISLTLFLVVILKNWIARPRPDFIARCQPDIKRLVAGKTTYDISICTGDRQVLLEGLRSTPSGHSALAYAGLHLVSIWIFVKFDILSSSVHFWKVIIASLPEWLALWIALSRTQDYRHHFGDIVMGGVIGVLISHLVWFKMFKGKEPVYLDNESADPDIVLPVYNTVQ